LLVLLAPGCGKKSTGQLIKDLQAPDELTRLEAVRTLPAREADAAEVIPALIEALKDESDEVRRGAAFGLGTFGERARDAIPALLACQRDDPEASVRKAAGTALSFIDPTRASNAGSSDGPR
jgi:HEAT repeat protein